MLETEQALLHGVIDLLYLDETGVWRLIDWKTEWSPAERIMERAEEHRVQVAAYTRAAERLLGVQVEASVCFLDPDLVLHRYQRSELLAEPSLPKLHPGSWTVHPFPPASGG